MEPSSRHFISQSGVDWFIEARRTGLISKEILEAVWETENQRDPQIFFSVMSYKPGMLACPVCGVPSQACRYPEEHVDLWFHGGIQLYDWQRDLLIGNIHDYAGNYAHTIIVSGGPGCGKTALLAIITAFWGILNPGFRVLTAAPSVKQNHETTSAFERLFDGTPVMSLTSSVRKSASPYHSISYKNNSFNQIFTTAAFAAGSSTQSNLGAEGDWVNYDEAAIDPNFITTMKVLGGRTRGLRSDNEVRGINYPDGSRVPPLVLFANPNDDMPAWADYVDTCRDAYGFCVLEIGVNANKSISSSQQQAVRDRMITIFRTSGGTIDDAEDYLAGVQQPKDGKKFRAHAIRQVIDEAYIIPNEYITRSRTNITFEIPPLEGHLYIMTFDPGTSRKPQRNAPAIMVWDITSEIPILVGMYWGSTMPGKARPSLQQLAKWIKKYNCAALVDTSGPQGILLEEHRDAFEIWDQVIPVQFGGNRYNSLEERLAEYAVLDAEHGGFKLPNLREIKRQLRDYYPHAPQSVAQDLVICILLMIYYIRSTQPKTHESEGEDMARAHFLAHERQQLFYERHRPQHRRY